MCFKLKLKFYKRWEIRDLIGNKDSYRKWSILYDLIGNEVFYMIL